MVFGKKPEGVKGKLVKILEEFEKKDPDVLGSITMRSDGLILASAIRAGLDADLAAAMLGSILNISTRVSQELKVGEVEDIVIKAKEGIVSVVPVMTDIVLGAIARSGANLGLLLIEMRRTSEKIRNVMKAL